MLRAIVIYIIAINCAKVSVSCTLLAVVYNVHTIHQVVNHWTFQLKPPSCKHAVLTKLCSFNCMAFHRIWLGTFFSSRSCRSTCRTMLGGHHFMKLAPLVTQGWLNSCFKMALMQTSVPQMEPGYKITHVDKDLQI